MVDTVYIEKSLIDDVRAKQVLARNASARMIEIDRYGEVFNSRAQNFRIQKQNPSLILASKEGKKVLPAPYETGGVNNYYFSHMLNCIYDCRYCFLQGMYPSANYLLFMNYEEFIAEIRQVAEKHKDHEHATWFYSGYDCDSLALEPVTGFADYFVDAFKDIPNSVLELRTKSTQIRSLLRKEAQDNVVVAFSLNPKEVATRYEKGTPSLRKRLDAIKALQSNGWRVAIRFDPVIWHDAYKANYLNMYSQVIESIDMKSIENISIGGFRLPKDFYKKMQSLSPDEPLFALGLAQNVEKMVVYKREIEAQVLGYVKNLVASDFPEDKIHLYSTA